MDQQHKHHLMSVSEKEILIEILSELKEIKEILAYDSLEEKFKK